MGKSSHRSGQKNSPFLKKIQPNVAKVMNTEQMLSSRNANQREVIRNKNQASTGGKQSKKKKTLSSDGLRILVRPDSQ